MPRNELKFYLNIYQYEWFRERCRNMFSVDSHNLNTNGYPVFSAYFDTLDMKFFNQKINGEFDHHKVRIRIYDTALSENSFGFLEAKIKANQVQDKVRIPINFKNDMLNPENWVNIDNHDVDKIIHLSNDLYHNLNVYYEREAYEWNYNLNGMVRINFDKNLAVMPRAQLHVNADVLETYRIMPDDHVILEIKTPTGDVPDIIKKDLRALGVEQERISKYAEGIFTLSNKLKGYEVVI